MIPIFVIYIRITNYYRKVARELKRLDSISRSPIFAHFGESLGGLPVIRSFQRQMLFQRGNEVRLDDNIASYYALKVVDRWLSLRLEFLGNIIVFFSALLAVLSKSAAGSAGMSLTNALSITGLLNWAVRNGAETESLMNSVERIVYTSTKTPLEGSRSSDVLPSTAFHPNALPLDERSNPLARLPQSDAELISTGWPWRGGIQFVDARMRYRDDFEPVLKGVTLNIRPGERIGIVGRTGSGTAFRIYYYIFYLYFNNYKI